VQWSDDPKVFIANALSPAQVLGVSLNETETTALVKVPDKHLSLAIGKEGQNVRLAAKLTGWRIDIKSASELEAEKALQKPEHAEAEAAEEEEIGAEVSTGEPEEAELEPEVAEAILAAATTEEQAQGQEIEILMPVETGPSQPSKIRFAEEIMAGREGKAKKKETVKKEAEGKDTGVKAKKAKHKKTVYYEDEDAEG